MNHYNSIFKTSVKMIIFSEKIREVEYRYQSERENSTPFSFALNQRDVML